MTINQFLNIIKRAFLYSFNKKKLFFTYPFLIICGFFVIFFKAVSFGGDNWIDLCLIFMPILLSISVLYILGVFLSKIYYLEVKKMKVSYREVIKTSINSIIHTLHISLPPILLFLIIWIFFGLLVMVKEIPHVGKFIGSLIFIAPFFLVLLSILITIASFLLLFFATPVIALKLQNVFEILKEVFKNFKKNIFVCSINFVVAISFSFIVFLILLSSFVITQKCFYIPYDKFDTILQWLSCIAIFVFTISPFVIFFFNFAIEIFNYFQIKDK